MSMETWLGTSLFDIYERKGPWSFYTIPLLPNKYHQVLFQLPVTLQSVPKPHYNSQTKYWDEDYVRMPCSPNSLITINENGQELIKPRWEVICKSLTNNRINSSEDLEKTIQIYNNNRLPKFTALHHFFNHELEEDETKYFFTNVLPGIVKLALELPELIPSGIPILKRYHSRSISLSQMQIACLLANSFLCTFVYRKDTTSTFMSSVNFIRLFTAHDRLDRRSCISEKLKCICHYFRRILSNNPVGCVTFERKFAPKNSVPRWDSIDNNLGNTKIHINSEGTIEDAHGLLQVDFANKNIGGGVLGYGCVQEEIRFVICPELIISRLFIEQLADNEAVIITGVERFSNYSGYGDTFKWMGNVQDETPFDVYGRKRTSIVVIDATHFHKISDQFHPSAILRELNKAYVGFSSKQTQNLAPIATGNWGCGAFNGNAHLKTLIQLMACSAAQRNLVYYSFGDDELKNEFHKLHLFFATNQITISKLWRYLCRFCASGLSQDKLYSYIQQIHFDTKAQVSIKHFFPKKTSDDNDSSTSTSSLQAPSMTPSSPLLPESSTELLNHNETVLRVEEVKDKSLKQTEELAVKEKPIEKPSESLGTKGLKRLTSHDDIIRLIEVIDGCESSKKEEDLVNGTFLSGIDNFIKKHNSNKSNEEIMDIDVYVEEEEIEEEEREEVKRETVKPKLIVKTNDNKKIRITDYFSKTNTMQ